MIESILVSGADFIVWLQQFSYEPWKGLMRFFSWLGGVGYLFTLPLVLWCIDRRLGLQLLLMVALTLYLNTVIKEFFALSRPFLVDQRIISAGEIGYSFPSGHAQLVVVFWGLAALWVGRRWFTGLCLAIIFLTGLSRSYMGVHYPSDVLVGWLLGALMVGAWAQWGETLALWPPRRKMTGLWSVVAAMTLLALVLGSSAMVYGSLGMLLVAGLAGLAVRDAPASVTLVRRSGRYVLGLGLMFALLSGLSKVAQWSALPAAVDGFVLTGIFAAVVVAGLPLLFQKARL